MPIDQPSTTRWWTANAATYSSSSTRTRTARTSGPHRQSHGRPTSAAASAAAWASGVGRGAHDQLGRQLVQDDGGPAGPPGGEAGAQRVVAEYEGVEGG